MDSRLKRKGGATDFVGVPEKKRLRNSKERLRHRTMMRRLEDLVSLVPLNRELFQTRASQLKRAIEYIYYLEDTVQSICQQRDIPLPLDFEMSLADRSCLSEECIGGPTTLVEKAAASIDLPYTQTTPSDDDDAVVPDIEFSPDIPSSLEQETGEWERYGISKEDWMAAGSSQQNTPQSPDRALSTLQNTPQSPDQAVPTMLEKTFVDVIRTDMTSMPLTEAPEYFVISPSGDVTCLGKLL